MKKKLLMIVMAMVLCFALAACGGGGDKEKDDGIDPNATVTKEQYDELSDSKWYEMSPEEMEQSTKDWGDGYLVVDFPGPDDDSRVHVLFKDKEGDGNMTATSMSPTGQLIGD